MTVTVHPILPVVDERAIGALTNREAACALICAADLAMHIAQLRFTGRQLRRGTMLNTRRAVAQGLRKARADRRWWLARARSALAA